MIIDGNKTQYENLFKDAESDYEIHNAILSRAAFELLEYLVPDIILLNAQTPDMDGFEALKLLKASEGYKNIPVVFIFSRENPEDELKCLTLGAEDFIVFPCAALYLRKRLELCLSRDKSNKNIKAFADKAAARCREAELQARAAIRAKTALLDNISRELRAPLNEIINLAGTDQNIMSAAGSLTRLADDMRDIAKMETGEMTFDNEVFDLEDVAGYCRSRFSQAIAEKGLYFYCYAESLPGKKLSGDLNKLRRALTSLISNALKSTNEGGVKLFASVKSAVKNRATVFFEVKSSGNGGALSLDSDLGLNAAKGFIEMWGGELKAESRAGSGDKFSFEISFETVEVEIQNPPQDPEHDREDAVQMFKGEILICEDNAFNQQSLCERFAGMGVQSVIAVNGKEAVKIAAGRMRKNEKPFDLILMDIHMPEMDGFEAGLEIKSMECETPITAFTANIQSIAETNDPRLYERCGISDFLNKDFTPRQLNALLSKSLPTVAQEVAEKKTLLIIGGEESDLAELTQMLSSEYNIRVAKDGADEAEAADYIVKIQSP